jgi:hypothetical protein
MRVMKCARLGVSVCGVCVCVCVYSYTYSYAFVWFVRMHKGACGLSVLSLYSLCAYYLNDLKYTCLFTSVHTVSTCVFVSL